jgi:hypothetical protein
MPEMENVGSPPTEGEPRAPVAVTSARRSGLRWLGVTVAAAAMVVTALLIRDHFGVARPVAQAIEADPRNSGIKLVAHLKHRVLSSKLVLDLRGDVSASPAGVFRALFQAADVLHRERGAFDEVELARSGDPVFVISGRDFDEIGKSFGAGENPLYLLRTLPEKLRRPDGSRAFAGWEGGILGVTMRQLDDVTKAATAWVQGRL